MIRGTTPQFKFIIPYPKNEMEWVRIKFWQPNNPSKLLPITRTIDNCKTTDNPKELIVSLTAEETKRFVDKYKAKMQFRAKHLLTGTIFGTPEQLLTIYPMRDDIIEEDPTIPPANEEGWIVLDGRSITD